MLYQAIQEQYGLLFWMNELFPILSESHLSWDADLVAVEVVGLLAAFSVFVGPVVDLCQGFVRTAHVLRQDWRIHAGYSLLITLI